MSADGRAFITGAGIGTRLVTDIVRTLHQQQQQSKPAPCPEKEFKRGYRAAMERCEVQLRIANKNLEDMEEHRRSESAWCARAMAEAAALREQLATPQPISGRVRIYLRHYIKANGWERAREKERQLINTAAIAALEFYKGLACDAAFVPALGRAVLEQPGEFGAGDRQFVQDALQSLAQRQFLAGIGAAGADQPAEYPLIAKRVEQLCASSGSIWQQRSEGTRVGEDLMADRVRSLGLSCRPPDHVAERPLWSTSTCRVFGAEAVNASGVIWEGGAERSALKDKLGLVVAKNEKWLRGSVMMPGGVLIPAALKDRAGTYCQNVPFL